MISTKAIISDDNVKYLAQLANADRKLKEHFKKESGWVETCCFNWNYNYHVFIWLFDRNAL